MGPWRATRINLAAQNPNDFSQGNTWTAEGRRNSSWADSSLSRGALLLRGVPTSLRRQRNFRDDLERAGISGARNTESGGYYRFLKHVDVTDPESKQQCLGVVDLLRRQACRVVVDPEPEAESAVAKFLDELRETMDCLHFDP